MAWVGQTGGGRRNVRGTRNVKQSRTSKAARKSPGLDEFRQFHVVVVDAFVAGEVVDIDYANLARQRYAKREEAGGRQGREKDGNSSKCARGCTRSESKRRAVNDGV